MSLYMLWVSSLNSRRFSSSRHRAFTTRTPVMDLVIRRGDLRVHLADDAVLRDDLLAELDRHIHQDGDDQQHDQRQPPVDDEHEYADVATLMTAQVVSSTPQVIRSETRSESEVTRAMIQPTGVLL